MALGFAHSASHAAYWGHGLMVVCFYYSYASNLSSVFNGAFQCLCLCLYLCLNPCQPSAAFYQMLCLFHAHGILEKHQLLAILQQFEHHLETITAIQPQSSAFLHNPLV